MKTSIALIALLFPAFGSGGETQVTVFGGYEAGGGLDIASDVIGIRSHLQGAPSFGASTSFRLGHSYFLELLYARSATSFSEPAGLFGPSGKLFDLTVNHFHGGLEWEFGEEDRIRPFVEGLIGASLLDPDDAGRSSAWFFSGSIGGGVKLFFSPHVGIKLKARYIPVVLQSDSQTFCAFPGGCLTSFDQSTLSRGEASAGLTFRW